MIALVDKQWFCLWFGDENLALGGWNQIEKAKFLTSIGI